MEKITFKDSPDTTTPVSSTNLNKIQDNVEDAISDEFKIVECFDTITTPSKTFNSFKLRDLPTYTDYDFVGILPKANENGDAVITSYSVYEDAIYVVTYNNYESSLDSGLTYNLIYRKK